MIYNRRAGWGNVYVVKFFLRNNQRLMSPLFYILLTVVILLDPRLKNFGLANRSLWPSEPIPSTQSKREEPSTKGNGTDASDNDRTII